MESLPRYPRHLAEIGGLYCSNSGTEELGSIVAKHQLLPNTEKRIKFVLLDIINTHLSPMFANLDVKSAAMRSLLYSSVVVAFFFEKKSISSVTVDMQDFSMLNTCADTPTSWSMLKMGSNQISLGNEVLPENGPFS